MYEMLIAEMTNMYYGPDLPCRVHYREYSTGSPNPLRPDSSVLFFFFSNSNFLREHKDYTAKRSLNILTFKLIIWIVILRSLT